MANMITNPRFIRYAQIQGNTPEAQMKLDEEKSPGGCMIPFSMWIRDQWAAFAESIGTPVYWAQSQQEDFDDWLGTHQELLICAK